MIRRPSTLAHHLFYLSAGIRPVSVWLRLLGTRTTRRLIAWFGIRGISSIYYLMYAIEYGLDTQTAERLTAITLTVVAVSITIHGISVTPHQRRYGQKAAG